MSEHRFTVDQSQMRLDQFLAYRMRGLARNYIQDMIRAGCVTVDGRQRTPAYRLSAGQVIVVTEARPSWPEDALFESWIIHEEESFMAILKPAGLLAHPMGQTWESTPEAVLTEKEATVAGLMLKHRPQASENGVTRCGVVHRLDRQTSGVLLLAKTPEAQESLQDAFRERRMKKVYRAIVLGSIEETTVDAPIGRQPNRRRVEVSQWGKPAKTDFKTVESAGGLSIVEARPLTGRTHQIRAHLALLEHPVAGDWEWFKDPERAELRRLGHTDPPRMMLHAYRLLFKHPLTGESMQLTAPLPDDFKAYWAGLGKSSKASSRPQPKRAVKAAAKAAPKSKARALKSSKKK